MPITHFASDELLLAHAAGRLSPAPALVLATHLEMAAESAARLRTFEHVGGALLDDQPLADVSPDLFERVLARLDEKPEPQTLPRRLTHERLSMGIPVPSALEQREIGAWRFMGPGMRFARVEVPEDPDFKVLLLRIGAGRKLPEHGHLGSELTVVLKGRFSDERASYGPGDIEEEDEDVDHTPVVDPDAECICLTAIEGSLKPNSWMARIAMPVFGF